MRLRVLVLVSIAGFSAADGLAQTRGAVPVPPIVRAPAIADAVPDSRGIKRMVVLRGLDKITGRAIDVDAPAGVPVRFGSLSITARTCYTVPPEEPPETSAFLQIDDGLPGEPPKRLFSGWMFASTPALNALEHAVYDVWVITCKTEEPAPVAPAEGASPPPASTPAPPEAPPRTPAEAPAAAPGLPRP